jgi:tripartite-type tricarboxylate transporter receptor subunit TctC
MEMFKAAMGLDMTHIPYRGSAPALNDTVAGHTQLMFATVNVLLGMLEKGQLKALITAETKRVSILPDVPTLAEAGVPGIDFTALVWSPGEGWHPRVHSAQAEPSAARDHQRR